MSLAVLGLLPAKALMTLIPLLALFCALAAASLLLAINRLRYLAPVPAIIIPRSTGLRLVEFSFRRPSGRRPIITPTRGPPGYSSVRFPRLSCRFWRTG